MAAVGHVSLPLPRRPLGKTGMSVSALGFGASPLGGVFGAVTEVSSATLKLASLPCLPGCFSVALLPLLRELFSPFFQAESRAAVHEAVRLGINFFDTSPYVPFLSVTSGVVPNRLTSVLSADSTPVPPQVLRRHQIREHARPVLAGHSPGRRHRGDQGESVSIYVSLVTRATIAPSLLLFNVIDAFTRVRGHRFGGSDDESVMI